MNNQLDLLLQNRSAMILCIDNLTSLINETYRLSLAFKVGDEVTYMGNRGVITEITYFAPIKIRIYRKDGQLSLTHRVCRNVWELEKV